MGFVLMNLAVESRRNKPKKFVQKKFVQPERRQAASSTTCAVASLIWSTPPS
jgi:hypothetical protein